MSRNEMIEVLTIISQFKNFTVSYVNSLTTNQLVTMLQELGITQESILDGSWEEKFLMENNKAAPINPKSLTNSRAIDFAYKAQEMLVWIEQNPTEVELIPIVDEKVKFLNALVTIELDLERAVAEVVAKKTLQYDLLLKGQIIS